MDEKSIADRVVHALREMFGVRTAAGGGLRGLAQAGAAERRHTELEAGLRAEKEARLAAETRLAELQESLEEKRREEELAVFSEALEEAIRQQRLTPAERSGYLKLGAKLDEQGRRAILEEVAERRPLELFSEISAPEKKTGKTEDVSRKRAQFSGFPEDPEHDAALELMTENPKVSFAEAIRRVRLDNRAAQ